MVKTDNQTQNQSKQAHKPKLAPSLQKKIATQRQSTNQDLIQEVEDVMQKAIDTLEKPTMRRKRRNEEMSKADNHDLDNLVSQIEACSNQANDLAETRKSKRLHLKEHKPSSDISDTTPAFNSASRSSVLQAVKQSFTEKNIAHPTHKTKKTSTAHSSSTSHCQKPGNHPKNDSYSNPAQQKSAYSKMLI